MTDPDFDNASGAAMDAAVGASASAEATAGRRRPRKAPPPTPEAWVRAGRCGNCGAPVTGPYCAVCGQSQQSMHRPVLEMIWDALGSLLALDGRLWRTAPPLLLQPGKVTRLYLTGARAQFVQPFRLFLFTTLLVFILANAVTGDGRDWVLSDSETRPADAPTRAAAPAPVIVEIEPNAPADDAEAEAPAETPEDQDERERVGRSSAQCAVWGFLTAELEPSPYCQQLREEGRWSVAPEFSAIPQELAPVAFRKALADQVSLAADRPDAYISAVKRWAPRVVLAMFPVYAVLLALLYVWRRSLYMYDHVVFSLHFHTALLMAMLVAYGIGVLIDSALAVVVFIIWSHVVLYRMQRVAYGAGRFGAVIRIVLLDVLYFVALVLAMVSVFALGFLFI